MTDPNIYKEYAATPGETIEQYIMDPHHPKSEGEWWASREITRLREENERLEKEIKKNRVALLRIQCIAQDITRPIPFQEEDDEN